MERKTMTGIMLTLILLGMLMLASSIRQVKAQGIIYIRPDGSIDPPTAAIQCDGHIYTFTDNIFDTINVERSDIVLDGAGLVLQGPGIVDGGLGIALETIRNITITNVTIAGWSSGIYIEGSSNNTIAENIITNNGLGVSVGGFPGVSEYNIVSQNQITNNEWGIVLSAYGRCNTLSQNEISSNTRAGIYISGDFADGNIILGNNIIHNVNGIEGFTRSSDNKVYHNNFIDNDEQVYSRWSPLDGSQVWDDGYPSGGNYWSDYKGVDVESGPSQDQAGSDGIGDTPYTVSPYSDDRPHIDMDHYPFMNPWTLTQTITASLEIDPGTLNLKNQGKWITVYIKLPEGHEAGDIDAATVFLNGTISCFLDPKYDFVTNSSEYLLDPNNDGILERMVKVDRTSVGLLIYDQGIRYGNVALVISGKLLDETPFEGTYVIFVNYAGDVNKDGRIDLLDAAAVSASWYPGPPTGPLGYDSNADFNNDGLVNILDGGLASGNWGQKVP